MVEYDREFERVFRFSKRQPPNPVSLRRDVLTLPKWKLDELFPLRDSFEITISSRALSTRGVPQRRQAYPSFTATPSPPRPIDPVSARIPYVSSQRTSSQVPAHRDVNNLVAPELDLSRFGAREETGTRVSTADELNASYNARLQSEACHERGRERLRSPSPIAETLGRTELSQFGMPRRERVFHQSERVVHQSERVLHQSKLLEGGYTTETGPAARKRRATEQWAGPRSSTSNPQQAAVAKRGRASTPAGEKKLPLSTKTRQLLSSAAPHSVVCGASFLLIGIL